MAKSGGVTARNTRQGFRSEYIVKYIFSAFGTAVDVSTENDIGIDLLCNLTSFDGLLITYKSTYGIQVKSAGTDFQYVGKQATKWLSKLEFPLLLVEVDKMKSKVKVFSTWNLNRFLLGHYTDNEEAFPDKIVFQPSDEEELSEPECKTGNIPVGKPILEFKFQDIDDADKCSTYQKVLEEWLEIENHNYSLRRAGISSAFGYIRWETNKPPSDFHVWYKPYFYSPHHTNQLKKILSEAFVALGLYNKASSEGGQRHSFKDTFNDLRIFANKYLKDDMDDFGKDLFKENI